MSKKMMVILMITVLTAFGMVGCDFLDFDPPDDPPGNGTPDPNGDAGNGDPDPNGVPDDIILGGGGNIKVEFDGNTYDLEEGFTGKQNHIELLGSPMAGADDGKARLMAASNDIDIDDINAIISYEEFDDLANTTVVYISFAYTDETPGTYDGYISFFHVDTNDQLIGVESDSITVDITTFGAVGESIIGTYTGNIDAGVILDLPDLDLIEAFTDEDTKPIHGLIEVVRLAGLMDLDFIFLGLPDDDV